MKHGNVHWSQRAGKWAMGIIALVLLGAHIGMPVAYALTETQIPIPGVPGLVVTIGSNVYQETQKQVNGFFHQLTIGGIIGLMNAFQVFTQKFAYDSAQAILTGDEGKSPLFYEKGFGVYLQEVALQASEQFVSSLNEEVFLPGLGLDLCAPIDPLGLQLGLGVLPPEQLTAKCTFAMIGSSFEQTLANIGQTDERVMEAVTSMFDPSSSEIGVNFGIQAAYQNAIAQKREEFMYERLEPSGVKPVTNFLSGAIKTPKQVVQDTFSATNIIKLAFEGKKATYGVLMQDAFDLGFSQLAILTTATFVGTLVSGAMQKIFDGLKPDAAQISGGVNLINPEALSNRNVANVRLIYSDLLTPNLFTSDKRDFVVEMAACPSPRGTFNCAMDDAFATIFRTGSGALTVAQSAHMTADGLPPTNPQYVHPDWELVPEWDVKENTDQSCYQRAYCASNLAKLRYARIIPVGWELAANSQFNKKKNGKYVTLGEALRGYSVCNEKGEADSSHPWCKLVDPNWILTAPPFQCRVEGYGDSIFPNTPLRLQECSDAVSCLKRDDHGNCTGGYGFCVAEKPVWRFTADECEAKFASCRTYVSRQSELVSYLRNTIDYGSCSADNVGCSWYSSEMDPASTSGTVWVGGLTDGPRIYLDATAEACALSDAGCTGLAKMELGKSALNLIQNGSFDSQVEGQDGSLSVWSYSGKTPVLSEESSVHGGRSYAPDPNNSLTSERVMIEPLRTYVVSAYVRTSTSTKPGDVTLTINLAKTDRYTDPVVPVDSGSFYRSEGCTIPASKKAISPGFKESFVASEENVTWRKFECTFVSNTSTRSGVIEILGTDVLVDSVQVEEAEVSTSYVAGVNSSLAVGHYRVPPEELACTGDEAQDNPFCSNYARICVQQDMGCQGYRDVNNISAPEIPATLSAVDLCPNQCVGYAEYLKQPSTFDLTANIDDRLNDPKDDTVATFIPLTATSCTINEVGCEAFTNVEATTAGGEDKAYFNYVRACEKPGADTETYFTWEGSDQTGYQLRTWSLIHDASQTPAPPKSIQKAGPEGYLKEPLLCNEQTWQQGADPDCRQFYNANGDVFYRYFTQTVISSPACLDFRKDSSTIADCSKTGGTFNTQTNDCIYKVLPSESGVCPVEASGCRAYLGATGRNTTSVFEEDFRNATTSLFSAGELSNEAILVGDASLKLTGKPTLDTFTVFPSAPNQLYKVTFWMKTTSQIQGSGTVIVDGKEAGSFPYAVDWRRYEIGPFVSASKGVTSTIAWTNLPDATFLDQIRIERLNDVTFVVKDSWKTPAICDMTPEGIPEPQAMLGCRAYRDRNDTQVTVRRFGHLCSEKAVGCTAFVDTRNSTNAYEETFVIKGTDINTKVTPESKLWESKYLGAATTTRSADRFVYLIDESSARCSASSASCKAFGKPNFTQAVDGLEQPQEQAFDTVYLKDDITKYMTADGEPNMLCRKDELFCDEFKSGQTVAYFRNPTQHACEWRDKVNLKKNVANGISADGEYNGWFRTGADIPCYPSFVSSGNTFLVQNSGDVGYTGWVGHCPVEQSECTEFRDPNDHSDPLHASAKPYYFIKNQSVDVRSCNGEVDMLNGCILFQDLSDPRLRFNVGATYNKSSDESDKAQQPIDCVTDPNNPYCRTCKEPKLDCGIGPWTKGGVCGRCNSIVIAPGVSCVLAKVNLTTSKFKSVTNAMSLFANKTCRTESDCSFPVSGSPGDLVGTCIDGAVNNANVVLKVNLDRDCAEWLGCATAETVYDPTQQKYVDVCTETALCDVSKGSNAGSFCGNYVNRNEDPILKPGAFFSRDLYVLRETGFGQKDYSGYAVPDQFQAVDIQNREVAKELFYRAPALQNKFINDYRLVAAVPESSGLLEFPPNEQTPLNPLYPDLLLCRHTQTGRTGYWNSSKAGTRVCYFAIDALSVRNEDLANQKDKVDPRNMEVLADIFRSSVDPKNDLVLERSFPPAECKANPEGDSPFKNTYVKEWNYTSEPFKPETVANGYGSANLCEWGEECSCAYRKVKYGGQLTKYYSALGKPPAAGVCSGGSNNGNTCVPGDTQQISALTGQIKTANSGADNPSCPGGQCLDISDVVLVRGQFGQCLQRDYARSVAGDPGQHPCLVWNPNPILAGTFDTYHYIPTAGYTPPVNAGEYYCLSSAQPSFDSVWDMHSRTDWQDSRVKAGLEVDGGNQFFKLPGLLSKWNYDTGYIAGRCYDGDATGDTCGNGESDCTCHDGFSNTDSIAPSRDYAEIMQEAAEIPQGSAWIEVDKACGMDDAPIDPIDDSCEELWRFTNLGQGIDGNAPFDGTVESPQATRCMKAQTGGDDDASSGGPPGSGGAKDGIGAWDNPPDADYQLARWIQTGRGIGRTQMEYFVPVKSEGIVKWLTEGLQLDTESDQYKAFKQTATLERNFAAFQFFAKPDKTMAACSIPNAYVDGVTVNDWTNTDQVTSASNQVFSAFQKDFDGKLDRTKDKILLGKNGTPVKELCSGLNDGKGDNPTSNESADNDGRCYYKYWETDYRMDGVTKFQWLDAYSGQSLYDRHLSYFSQERECTKSGFAIRAMFENADKSQNSISEDTVKTGQLGGPWRFIGFWITSCTAGTDFEQSLYLGLQVKHADICKNIGQVISADSRENAAFADRVWNKGSFVIPKLGYSYQADFPPFGSSLATDVPGKEPLFMTGGFVQDYSILKPPTFLGAGSSFVTLEASPLHKWGHLTNIFARVYRIYKFFDSGVDRTGRVCVGGPNDGASCPTPQGDAYSDIDGARVDQICGATGSCDNGLVPLEAKNAVHRCNALSGVNAGLSCGDSFSLPSLDPTCHNAAMKRVGNALVPQYTSCEIRPGWKKCEIGENKGKYSKDCEEPKSPKYSAKIAHEGDGVNFGGNAFGCGVNAVIPNAGCSEPSQNSKDCPLKVTGLTCISDAFGPMVGHCSGGYENARCSVNSDCVFTAAQWWGAYDTGKPQPGSAFDEAMKNYKASKLQYLGAKTYPVDGSAASKGLYPLPFSWTAEVQSSPVQDMSQISRRYWGDVPNNIWPGIEYFVQHIQGGAFSNPFSGGGTRLEQLWPTPHVTASARTLAGVCEGALGALMDPNGVLDTKNSTPVFIKYLDGDDYARNDFALIVGKCDGGINEGNLCFSNSEINPEFVTIWPHPNTCAPQKTAEFDPYKDKGRNLCQTVANENNDGSWKPTDACKFSDPNIGDGFSPDPDLDNNACTRSSGYAPWKEVCGQDPNNEKCLIGYDLAGIKSITLDQTKSLTPTDVTSGLHRPSFLGFSKANPADEDYIAFYAPLPPTIAAPDLSHTCSAPGSCPVSLLGRFTVEEKSEGVVSFTGGQGQATMRFYGWSAHEQTPLKELAIDWGDGTVTKISDARMKNKKPFCGGTRECSNVQGLTCNSDSDCPPAGGACVDVGTCSQDPSQRCFSNLQCEIGGKKGATCQIRQFFGNSDDACEQNYFEFSHAYACDATQLDECGSTKRCSRNPSIECTTSTQCGSGDECIAGLAPSSVEGATGGCFDVQANACRFTPKVLLKDNWNWCTGECRAGPILGNEPSDVANARVKHLYGGCWDGTETVKNTEIQQSNKIMYDIQNIKIQNYNECTLDPSSELNKNIRPWVVFPGSVQVGVFK